MILNNAGYQAIQELKRSLTIIEDGMEKGIDSPGLVRAFVTEVTNTFIAAFKLVTGVSIEATATVAVAANVQLNAAVAPASAENKTVTFDTSDIAVATVNASGLVHGVGAGVATITVRTLDGNFTDTCTVTVTA